MGGSKTEIVQPTPPASPTPAQSARDYAAALPSILQAQLQYQPQFDQAAFESFQQLAPQYATVARETLQQYSPTLASLDEELAKQALQQSQQGLSQDEIDFYRDQFKAGLSGGNQINSGLGADFIAKNLLAENLARKSQGQNLGLSLQGKVPITQAFQQPSQFQVANSFAPSFATQSSTFGSVFSGAGRPIAVQNQRPDIIGGIGGALQGIGSIASGGGLGAIFG